jgi:hypothetical protein
MAEDRTRAAFARIEAALARADAAAVALANRPAPVPAPQINLGAIRQDVTSAIAEIDRLIAAAGAQSHG